MLNVQKSKKNNNNIIYQELILLEILSQDYISLQLLLFFKEYLFAIFVHINPI